MQCDVCRMWNHSIAMVFVSMCTLGLAACASDDLVYEAPCYDFTGISFRDHVQKAVAELLQESDVGIEEMEVLEVSSERAEVMRVAFVEAGGCDYQEVAYRVDVAPLVKRPDETRMVVVGVVDNELVFEEQPYVPFEEHVQSISDDIRPELLDVRVFAESRGKARLVARFAGKLSEWRAAAWRDIWWGAVNVHETEELAADFCHTSGGVVSPVGACSCGDDDTFRPLNGQLCDFEGPLPPPRDRETIWVPGSSYDLASKEPAT